MKGKRKKVDKKKGKKRMFDTQSFRINFEKKIFTNMTLIFISDATANLIHFYVFNYTAFIHFF